MKATAATTRHQQPPPPQPQLQSQSLTSQQPPAPPRPAPSAAEMEHLRRELDEIERGLQKAPKVDGGAGGASRPAPMAAAPAAGSSSSAALVKGSGDKAENMELQLQMAKKLRDLLSSNREALIHDVLERDWIPRLLDWLKLSDYPAIQVEALWALTNIAAGTTEHTNMLLRHNPVPALVGLLESPNQEVLEQAVWVLGNIAGEGAASRDIVLSNDALRPLVQCVLRHQDSQQILRIGSWALNNLCDSQPRPALDIAVIMPALRALVRSDDSEVLSHTCWALSHLCDGPSAHIKAVVEADICWRLVELLHHRSWRVTKPALRTIGNIVCAEDEVDYTQYILEAGAVPPLRGLIAHSNREIQKEACWTLSNIAAGTCEQIQTVLDSGAIPLLVQLAMQPLATTDAEVRSEACWVVLNATSCGSDAQIEYLVKEGCIRVLGDLLGEANMVMMALEGLERILQVGDEEARRGEGVNPYAAMLSAAKIEELESHRSAAVAKRAQRIWKQHFVTCAICNQTFSKQSPSVLFCKECKCYVCGGCNCTIFHLSYQEELWKEVEGKEASAKEAAQNAKRNKKQRKKQKEKEKREKERKEELAAAKGGGGGGKALGGRGGSSLSSSSSPSSSDNESPERRPSPTKARTAPPPPPSPAAAAAAASRGRSGKPAAPVEPPAASAAPASSGGKRSRMRPGAGAGASAEAPLTHGLTGSGGGAKCGASELMGNGRGAGAAGAAAADAGVGMGSSGGGKRGRNRGGAEVGSSSASSSPASSSVAAAASSAGAAATRLSSSRASAPAVPPAPVAAAGAGGGGGGKKAGGSKADDIDLVEFLQNTGSIIALSKYLDDAEDDEEHDLLAEGEGLLG